MWSGISMPRILFNMPSQFAGRPSGVARVAFELLHRLVGKGDFEYILRSPWSLEQLPGFLQDRPLEVVVVPRPSILVSDVIRQALTFASYCRREKIDLVVNLDPYGAATGGRARLMVVHDLYFKTIPKQIGRRARFTNDLIYRLMLGGNSNIVTVSNSTQIDLEYWYPQTKSRITTIHSGTSLQPNQGQSSAPAVAGRYVMAVGNATENKNFARLAEAMASIYSSDPDIALVHVGDDPGEILGRTLQQMNSPVRLVRFSGVDDAQLTDLYRNATCLCVPSLYEGFCLPILEAQVCGCPVVCSNRSAMPEIAGKGAVLIDPTDSVVLADALKSVLASPEKAATLARLGLKNAERFSWDEAAHRYYDLFVRVLELC
jgi:glycosyltransferase involved in cell wall biosynthesis